MLMKMREAALAKKNAGEGEKKEEKEAKKAPPPVKAKPNAKVRQWAATGRRAMGAAKAHREGVCVCV